MAFIKPSVLRVFFVGRFQVLNLISLKEYYSDDLFLLKYALIIYVFQGIG